MSIEALKWSFSLELQPLPKLVLIMLSNRHNNDTGICWPSMDKLARDCGMSKNGVRNQVSKLSELGLLSVIHSIDADGRQTSNRYRLHVGTGVHGVEGEGAHGEPPGVHGVEGEGARHAPESISEPITVNPGKETDSPGKPGRGSTSFPDSELPEWMPKDTWADFKAFRKRIKKPTDGTSEKLLIAKIGRLSGASETIARKIMEESIANGWQGVFALKESKEEAAAGLSASQPQQPQARKLNLAELRSKSND